MPAFFSIQSDFDLLDKRLVSSCTFYSIKVCQAMVLEFYLASNVFGIASTVVSNLHTSDYIMRCVWQNHEGILFTLHRIERCRRMAFISVDIFDINVCDTRTQSPSWFCLTDDKLTYCDTWDLRQFLAIPSIDMPINVFEDLSDDTWLHFLTERHFAPSLKESESKLT
jgi:hypothetical protein